MPTVLLRLLKTNRNCAIFIHIEDLLHLEISLSIFLDLKVAEPCEKLITNCFWKSRQINCSEIFIKSKTQSGFCCSSDLK